MSHVMNTYTRLPVAFTHGEGVWLWDAQGKRYLDALGGIAVNTLGHAHPRLTKTLATQAGKLIHTSNIYQITEQENLADKLAAISGMDKIFFCNSGCEANEAAIKIARLYARGKGFDNPAIVVMEKAFHGRTLATLSATGSRKVQAGFEPLVSGFVRVPYDDLEAVRQVAEHNRNVVAVLVEPIQGEGGVNIAHLEYLSGLRGLCDRYQWLLMLDEIQCGLGRTGKWFFYQHAGFLPDVVTLAKGLAAGVPIGACLARGAAAEVFKPGNHGSTFGGNPFACAAALTTLEIIEQDKLLDNATRVGDAIRTGLAAALAGVKGVVAVRGMGLMLGIELDRPCGELTQRALDAGLLINVTADKIVRLLPPLIMNRDESRQLVDMLSALIRDFLSQPIPAR
ncbi:MAG: aspartate aminotransferase family protein [Betaproteobacteria bacterium]|nr:MAG: aspartate aminotransferase family protein [Betaproteobacteria bacterium]